MTPDEPKAGSVPPELETMMLEDFGPPDHTAAETDAVNIVTNFEPQDCDEVDLNNARAYLALRAELAAIKAQASDATEYVLAVENRELRAEVERLKTRVKTLEDLVATAECDEGWIAAEAARFCARYCHEAALHEEARAILAARQKEESRG